MLFFVTGNKNKFEEVKQLLPEIEQLELDLPEIQEIDSKEIVKAKLKEAAAHHKGDFIVEDTALHLDCLNGLPGPFIKWFLKELGREGLANLAEKIGKTGATARTTIGLSKDEKIHFFEGTIRGNIVQPRGDRFGWDPIFQPEGYELTFAEMEEKNKISHRRKALDKLKEFLTTTSP